jgi:acyl dehydratase
MREYYELTPELAFTASSQGRTITEGDFSAMCNLTWTTAEYHTDRMLMAETPAGERNLAGACVLAFALGLATPAVRPQLKALGVTLIALVGYDEIRFLAPLQPGDTIQVHATVERIAKTSKPHRGVITFRDTVRKNRERDIMTYTRSALCDVSESALYSATG